MSDNSLRLVQTLPDTGRIAAFAQWLLHWLLVDGSDGESAPGTQFTVSRAKALLRATGSIDDPTLNDFDRLLRNPTAQRVALFDLLRGTGVAAREAVQRGAAAAASGTDEVDHGAIPWLTLALAAHAWERQYPVRQLDPVSPPEKFSPAGQVVSRAAHFLRKQVQRNATDRDKLAKKLAYRERGAGIDDLAQDGPVAPLPPHYRTPVPVRYPEVVRDTLHVDPGDASETPSIRRGDPIVITEEDLPGRAGQDAARMPPLRINPEQVTPPNPPSPLPATGVIMPSAAAQAGQSLTVALRRRFSSEEMQTTKLRVIVQEHPDGPGLYGLQVRVTCKGMKSHVAGTTGRDGQFLAELPVRLNAGLTYDVEVTWPRDLGGDVERKSITINADRTEFRLPFYTRLRPKD